MGDAYSRSLRFDSYARMQHFVRRSIYAPFDVFGGMCGDNSCTVFLLLFMALWVPMFTTLCMRTVLVLWHAVMFLGLRHVVYFPSPFLLIFVGVFQFLFL
jgi:hypothetical protein